LIDFIVLQSRSGEEEVNERCGASVETADDADAADNAMKSLDNSQNEL